jgi:tetratricopeptide (TPR) repeat protein
MRARVWLVALLFAAPAVGQVTSEFASAYQAERAGRFADAAAEYERILVREPANLQALFGLERMLQRLEAPARLLPRLDSALARAPGSHTIWGLKLRTLGTLDSLTGVQQTAEQWIAREPRAAEPYREWAFVLAGRALLRDARRVLERGQESLGGSSLLAELAQVAVVAGDWQDATRRWLEAARLDGDFLASAAIGLTQAPSGARAGVIDLLMRQENDSTARLLAADILIAWGRADEAWVLLDSALPADDTRASAVLRRFADRARLVPRPETAIARGRALERVADLTTGPAAQQARVDAARAYADGGDRDAAARMLERIADDPSAAPPQALGAMVTMIGVAADAGRVDEAERRYREWHDRLPADDRDALRARLVHGWLVRGDVPRARTLLPADSSVEAMALVGWVGLAAGQVTRAVEGFRLAGPFTGTRSEATARTGMLARLQRVTADSLAPLGAAVLALLAADTTSAIAHLETLAPQLPPTEGGSDLLAWAGQLAVAADDPRAQPLLERALAMEENGPQTPGALFGLAELAVRGGRTAEAVERLEALILDHPTSAVIPHARRLLDQVRGRVPVL